MGQLSASCHVSPGFQYAQHLLFLSLGTPLQLHSRAARFPVGLPARSLGLAHPAFGHTRISPPEEKAKAPGTGKNNRRREIKMPYSPSRPRMPPSLMRGRNGRSLLGAGVAGSNVCSFIIFCSL